MIKRDGKHWDSVKIDSYNKIWNFILSGRGPGKSSWILKKILDAHRKKESKTIWILRNESQFTDLYINEFLNHQDADDLIACQTGVFHKELTKGGKAKPDYTRPVAYFIAISTAVAKVKSIQVDNVDFIVFEEFIPNLRMPNQRYQRGEVEALLTVYDTIARNNDYKTKVYMLGNPYQLANPYFLFFKIDPAQVKRNKNKIYVPQPDIAIDYFDVHPDLVKERLDTPYARIAALNENYYNLVFGGEESNPMNSRILKSIPQGARLLMLLKVQNQILQVYQGVHFWKDEIMMYYFTNQKYKGNMQVHTFDFNDYDQYTNLLKPDHPYYEIMKNIGMNVRMNKFTCNDNNTSFLINEIAKIV
jgi:hypothetical protein